MMHIADSTKEYIVKKNIYSLGTVLTFCGAMAAVCSFMMKTYVFYKMNGYLDYFGVRQELIGIEDEYSLFTFSMMLIGLFFVALYSSFIDTFLGNLNFYFRYQWKYQNKKDRMTDIIFYIFGFLILEIGGMTIITMFMPILEIENKKIGKLNIISGMVFMCVNMLLVGIKLLLKKHMYKANENIANKSNNDNKYIKLFDDFVYYFAMIIILISILIGLAPLMGRDLAKNKTSFYTTIINGETYAIIYNNDNYMIAERCNIIADELYLYVDEQMISDKKNHILTPCTFDLVDVVSKNDIEVEENKKH